MRELGKRFCEGTKVTLIGQYCNYESYNRYLVDRIMLFDSQVRAYRKNFGGDLMADHLYLEKEPFDEYLKYGCFHNKSLVVLSGEVEYYNRKDDYTDRWFKDAGLKDISIPFWIIRSRPNYIVYSLERMGDDIFGMVDMYTGNSWQECVNYCRRYV